MHIIPLLRLMQKNHVFEAHLGYMVSLNLKKEKKNVKRGYEQIKLGLIGYLNSSYLGRLKCKDFKFNACPG